ncbi:MAG: hypothetical protein IKP98_00540 [Bacilli bacterium]|nr:hypothetical protein [Bacilli bacterium]
MNKELIELQRGSKATCVVVKNSDLNKLGNAVHMDSRINDSWLFGAKMGNPIIKEKVDIVSKNGEIGYFVVTNFDSLSVDEQNKYVPIIKDRELLGYTLPDNIIIVLSIENKESLKNISSEIYHFCVVSI